jgi:hypothetical protein
VITLNACVHMYLRVFFPCLFFLRLWGPCQAVPGTLHLHRSLYQRLVQSMIAGEREYNPHIHLCLLHLHDMQGSNTRAVKDVMVNRATCS